MNTYFETATTSPDERMIEAERKDLLLQIENMHKEIDKLHAELSHMRSDNETLKEAVVRMSLKMVGVTN